MHADPTESNAQHFDRASLVIAGWSEWTEKPWYPPVPEGFGPWYRGSTAVAIALECLDEQPTQEQVEQTQKPETPEADAAEDNLPDNQPMFTHDAAGIDEGCWTRFNARQAWQKPTAAPAFMVRDVRSSDGLLTVREADHRPGLWRLP